MWKVPLSRAYIFKGSLVQELDSLTAEHGLLRALCILLLPLFCRFSGGGGTGVSHPKVFRDQKNRKERKFWASIHTHIHAGTPTWQNGAPPTAHYAYLGMREQAHSSVCSR